MESSEDDAGTATSASRRASAREKDVGLAEDVNPTRNIQHDPSEARASCRTPAMSEDNFDGDSVPSPSTKDTSTEAILDMIDDFIDGPGAPKRLPFEAQTTDDPACGRISPSHTATVSLSSQHESDERKQQNVVQPQEQAQHPSADSESLSDIVHLHSNVAQCTTRSEVPLCATSNNDLPQSSTIRDEVSKQLSPQQFQLQVGTELAVISCPSNSVEPKIIIEQPTLDSLESVKTETVILPSCSEPLPTEKPIVTPSSSSSEQQVIIEQPFTAAASSSTEPEQVTEQIALIPSSSGSVLLEEPVIAPMSSSGNPESLAEQPLSNALSEVSLNQSTSSLPVRRETETLPELLAIAPTSSSVKTVQVPLGVSECDNVESRTVKCVTSSENKDNVTVELVESTSSECSVSESKPLLIESVSRSPLKRRLIRPAPSDRRPDSTVSSTVDSRTTDINSTDQSICETVTKDVSSSSDAVCQAQVSNKPEEISNVNEISICKAETSTSASRKIKLVRPKSTHVMSNSAKSETQISPNILDKNQCQSTSDDISTSIISSIQASSRVSSIISENQEKVQTKCVTSENEFFFSTAGDDVFKDRTSTCEPSVSNIATLSAEGVLSVGNLCKEVKKENVKVINVNPDTILSLSQSKLTETSSTVQASITESCNIDISTETSYNKSQDDVSTPDQDQSHHHEVTAICNDQLAENNKIDIGLDNMSKNDEKTVPPIKLSLSIADHSKNAEGVEKCSVTKEESITKSGDFKQVPKLTIKLTNKHIEEEKSSIPKLTIKPLRPPVEQNTDDLNIKQSSITKVTDKPLDAVIETVNEKIPKQLPTPIDILTNSDIPNVIKINIKAIPTPSEEESDSITKPPPAPSEEIIDKSEINEHIPIVTKITIKPILKTNESLSKPSLNIDDHDKQLTSNVRKINIKPIPLPSLKDTENEPLEPATLQNSDNFDTNEEIPSITKINIKPIPNPSEKLNDCKSKHLRSAIDHSIDGVETKHQIPNVTKINIKPIPKPMVKEKEVSLETENDLQTTQNEQIPSVTKLNIKPIPKPPEKINEIHRKSSSSEISESEYSENDESTSTSDQASASDQGPIDTIPKVTIKLGKPGTESEGKFYTEKNIPKLTIKNIQHSDDKNDQDKLKLIISQCEDKELEKVPKITIKTVTKSESQPLSPKLSIKPSKASENLNKDSEVAKFKLSTELFSSSAEVKENLHVPKITIKPVIKSDTDGPKTPKKSTVMCDSSEHIPVVTKLNIKPILKPTESGESSVSFDDKVPVVSKLNIKPVIKPKDNEVESSIEDVPKIIKLNIKPLKNPEESSSEKKDCDEKKDDMNDNSSIPVVTKLNIKPILKPVEDEVLKDSENQSSETGNSSDDNADHIPMVTKLIIKPVVKPSELEEPAAPAHTEQSIPVVTKLNIKPLVKPEDTSSSSPKRESLRNPGNSGIPVVTKLNIKPIVKPEEHNKPKEENIDKTSKTPPLVMKINMKSVTDSIPENEHMCNNVSVKSHSPKLPNSPKLSKRSTSKEINTETSSKPKMSKNIECNPTSPSLLQPILENSHESSPIPEIKKSTNELHSTLKDQPSSNTVSADEISAVSVKSETLSLSDKSSKKNVNQINELNEANKLMEHHNTNCTKPQNQSYTLLKKLLSATTSEKTQDTEPVNCKSQCETPEIISNCKDTKIKDDNQPQTRIRISSKLEKVNDIKPVVDPVSVRPIQEVRKECNESITKPLEIITDKISNQGSGQDSPRIILKINKTDHGASSKIITEEVHKPVDCSSSNESEQAAETVNDIPSPKKHVTNSRRKNAPSDTPTNMTIGKRLRSSRIVESAEKSPVVKRNINKRPSASETSSPPHHKESELSMLDTKRMKLEQLLSVNKSLTITPVESKVIQQSSPSKSTIALNQVSHNHSLLSNENSQKNGNSKLHNILSNLQAKQMHNLQLNDDVSEKVIEITTEIESNTSTGSSDVVVEITRIENCHPEVQEMMINENSVCDLTETDEVSQDPLEVETIKQLQEEVKEKESIKIVELTPTPRKRGRPRKQPLPENTPPPTPVPLPTPALEQRPQRSLRLMRERPTILRKPRGGRGRGRGGRRPIPSPVEPEPEPEPEPQPEPEPIAKVEVVEPPPPEPIDPTSSRIKLPRMTEALDKSVAGCNTPLTSRRRSSATSSDMFSSSSVLDSPMKSDDFMKSPEMTRPKSGRGSRGGRIRTSRNRGRGRGGGRGAMYMKETLGIYGRVCGPATTTVQLFEEETCMMDDNATPSKPSHLLDEDSQSSVKSSTNDSNKMKKSKFADLFDSSKVWTAADVKEYMWPPPDTPKAEQQVMMIQEQVAMFLGVKSFKRRYPELKRRTVGGEERDYVLSKGVVTEALCDLGITAVDASEVLDIMLSDYPHKYEEYRVHQREKQIASLAEEVTETKSEERPLKVEVKTEKTSDKPDPPKVDPEKTRQDMAAAAIASAAEWNARANAWRRPASVDLQSMTIHRRRPPPPPPPPARVMPPAGFYPHALLPGQFQHWYRTYTSEQLRYFPLNTVLAAPPAPPSPTESSSESDGSWGDHSSSSDDSDAPPHHSAKRKKLSRVKRSSQQDKDKEDSRGPEPEVETCRVCKLRLEANRKYTHERFLVCANCNANLHPGCVELPPDTIRKCREYPWQCAECKSCCACRLPKDDDKMLFCDLCDRGFHIYCVGLDAVPSGRWHCVECAICKSCGARDPNGLNPGVSNTAGPSTPGPSTPGVSTGPAEWHHQTRRGPGGHKVYSHSLCTPCARAYRIGRYCPLCDRSFVGPKGTMQLVICKLCDRQLHQECVRATVAQLKVLDYTCGECRRGGITSRAAAVRLAPRTIATLFMAKRRFNKYAHRQYLQSRLAASLAEADEGSEEPLDADVPGVDDSPD